jgi:hypothetical protein
VSVVITTTEKCVRGGPNELGHIFGESIFDRLHRGLGERHIVSLLLASYFDCTSRMVGTKLLPMYENNSRGNVVARYANLWHTPNKRRQTYNNVTFYVYFDTIRYIIEHTPHIIVRHGGNILGHCAIQRRDAPYVYSGEKGRQNAKDKLLTRQQQSSIYRRYRQSGRNNGPKRVCLKQRR